LEELCCLLSLCRISQLLVYVKCCRGLSHGFAHLVGRAPDWVSYILLVSHIVLLLLLAVVVLGRALAVPTECLVEASVLQVTTLPGPIVGYESRLLGLLSKRLAGAEGHD